MKKNQIVVTTDVKRNIEDEARRLTRQANRRITQGDLVKMAVEFFLAQLDAKKEESNSDSSDTITLSNPIDRKDSVTDAETLQLQQSEVKWVRQLVEILRSGNRTVKTAIQHNIEAFSLIVTERPYGGADPVPDLPGVRPEVEAALAGADVPAREAERTQEDAQRVIEEHRRDRPHPARNRKRTG